MLNFANILKKIIFLCFLIFITSLAVAEDASVTLPGDGKAVAEAPVTEAREEAQDEDRMDFRDPFKTWLPSKKDRDVVIDRFEDGYGEPAGDQGGEEFDYSGLDVTGIVWGEAMPKAIINDEVYGIGDQVNEATIMNINKDGILLKFKDKEYLMKRGKENISEKGGGI
ncbi:MAG TPA: hypothetical protein DCL35_03725 [Candidatus Omnitrophica bacterium]|nr:hypothetical protein [Candidatus Omnitrophota bacterium]